MGQSTGDGLPPWSWSEMADLMWQGMTIQQASSEMGLEYKAVMWWLNVSPDVKRFLVDVGMLASVKGEVCNG